MEYNKYVCAAILMIFTCAYKCSMGRNDTIAKEEFEQKAKFFAEKMVPAFYQKGYSSISVKLLDRTSQIELDAEGFYSGKIKINAGKKKNITGDFRLKGEESCTFKIGEVVGLKAKADVDLSGEIRFDFGTGKFINGIKKSSTPKTAKKPPAAKPLIDQLNKLLATRKEMYDDLPYKEKKIIDDYYRSLNDPFGNDGKPSVAGLSEENGMELIRFDRNVKIVYDKIINRYNKEQQKGLYLFGVMIQKSNTGNYRKEREKKYRDFMATTFDESWEVRLHKEYEILMSKDMTQICIPYNERKSGF